MSPNPVQCCEWMHVKPSSSGMNAECRLGDIWICFGDARLDLLEAMPTRRLRWSSLRNVWTHITRQQVDLPGFAPALPVHHGLSQGQADCMSRSGALSLLIN